MKTKFVDIYVNSSVKQDSADNVKDSKDFDSGKNVPESHKFIKKSEFNPEFEEFIKRLDKNIQLSIEESSDSPIFVDEISSKIAGFYENARKVVDWQDENVASRIAIERILKRFELVESKISGGNQNYERLSKALIVELIRSGYLPNGKIGYKKIKIVARVLEKYTSVKNLNLNRAEKTKIAGDINTKTWLNELLACEVENSLERPYVQNELTHYMHEKMASQIRLIPEGILPNKDLGIIMYIATLKSLYHVDDTYLHFKLIQNYFSKEESNLFDDNIINVEEVSKKIDYYTNHKMLSKFYYYCDMKSAYYRLIGEASEELVRKIDTNKKKITKKQIFSLIKKIYKDKREQSAKRSKRAAIYSTISVLLAGMLSLFVIEVPISRLLSQHWSPISIIVDLTLPFIVMIFIVFTVKSNKNVVIDDYKEEFEKIIYGRKIKETHVIEEDKERSRVSLFFALLMYLAPMYLVLWLSYEIFLSVGVPFTSLYINVINVAMVIFAGIIIRTKSQGMNLDKKESLAGFYFDIFTVPIARFGKWVANKWKVYNFLNIFVIAFLDMPFNKFVNFVASWRGFVKDKKMDISA